MDTNKKNAENAACFVCKKCDFKCSKQSNWTTHISTHKHKILTNPNEKNADKKYVCNCGKLYKHMSSLCAHKKKCVSEQNIGVTMADPILISETIEPPQSEISQLTNLVLEVVKSNLEVVKSNSELQKQVIELSKNNQFITNNNHVNSHNKTFNLQVFLNETCKDAMNITDFVDSLQIQLTDLENVGKNGFVNGISNIIIKNLKALDVSQRPIHCNDQKRETVYIKDNNQWYNDSKSECLNDNKDLQENHKLKKAIKQIAHKNICMIPQWKAKYPDCVFADSRKSDLYNHIIYESMDHNEQNSEKIIKKIVKEVVIEK
jgi:hypothetical protein